MPGIGPRRAEIIVAGAQVFAEFLESFGLRAFATRRWACATASWRRCWPNRTRAPRHIGNLSTSAGRACWPRRERYGVDPRQAEPVRAHALQLFRELKPLHELPPEYESWLAAAAVLRDTGKFINHQGHHRHTQYIISSSEMYGYTQVQRTMVSAIARYLGKSRPQPGDRALRNIPAEEHKNVQRAVVLLRLAVALNQDRASDVLRVAARVYPKRVYLELRAGTDRRGTGAVVAAQGGGLLPRGLRAGAFRHAGIDPAGHARDRSATAAAADGGPCRCAPRSPCACGRRRRHCR